jgi:transcriptional regulator with PAS, ATPase and Fis domain
MTRILVSWVAAQHDFDREGGINTSGPSCSVHQHFYDGYDRHVLLTTYRDSKEDTKLQKLASHLRRVYKHTIIEEALDIDRADVISLPVISRKINALLQKYRHEEIDIFISPGTPAMQVAWYLAHLSLGLNTTLFQTVKAADSKTGKEEKITITIEQTNYISSLLIKDSLHDQDIDIGDTIIVGALTGIYARASKIALADVSVLITGDTGTGKELLARHIHASSSRSKERFVAVNCGALGDQLLESRLFGYEKGAFTGAVKRTDGLFHEANYGTIFLDEIGDISPHMQQSLLRVLSNKEIMRVGSTKAERINVRVICATNKDVYGMSMDGAFRDDLYYRLATSEIRLPSLKEYGLKDKERIFSYLWHYARREFKVKVEPKIPSRIKKLIMEYSYPGNIREMQNMIYGIWAEAEGEVHESHLPERLLKPRPGNSLKLEDIVAAHVKRVYTLCKGNIKRTATILGISENTVRTRLDLH